jgi:hypothetical protein
LPQALGLLLVGAVTGVGQAAVLTDLRCGRPRRWLATAVVGWPVALAAGYAANLAWLVVLGAGGALWDAAVGTPRPAPWAAAPLDGLPNTLAGVLVLLFVLGGPGGAVGAAVFGWLAWPAVDRPGAAVLLWIAAHALGGVVPGLLFFGVWSAIVASDVRRAVQLAGAAGLAYGLPTGLALARITVARDWTRLGAGGGAADGG